MDSALKHVAVTLLAILLFVGVHDMKSAQYIKHRLKDSLDLATKAAALELDLDPIKLGDGIFDIDVVKGTETFEEIFIDNMGDSFYSAISSVDIINTHTKIEYTAPNGDVYSISEPTIFASASYTYDGIFRNVDVTAESLAGSSIVNINDIK